MAWEWVNTERGVHFSANFTVDGFRIGFNTGPQLPPNALDPYGLGFSGVKPLSWGGGSDNGFGFNNLSDLRHIGQGILQDFRSLLGSFGGFFHHIDSFFHHLFSPVVLDLSGKGINIAPLSSSNNLYDMAGDGYQHHTAWAGAGGAMLVFDTNNEGKVTQRNQIVFMDWDPTATSDMQALRDVFDSNHDGKLDASGAKFSQFKLLVMKGVSGRRRPSRIPCDGASRQLVAA